MAFPKAEVQFESSDEETYPTVIVKNTFLDLDDTPQPDLSRVKTVPADFKQDERLSLDARAGSDVDQCHSRRSSTPSRHGEVEENVRQESDRALEKNAATTMEDEHVDTDTGSDVDYILSVQLGMPYTPLLFANQQQMLVVPALAWTPASTWTPQVAHFPRVGEGVQRKEVASCAEVAGRARLTSERRPSPQEEALTCDTSPETGFPRIVWRVDVRKFKANDRSIVSPPFELECGESAHNFKMSIYPIASSTGKCGFRGAAGKGFVQLKCADDLQAFTSSNLTFQIAISGDTGRDSMLPARGPVAHNFKAANVVGLPRNVEEWDFSSVINKSSRSVVIHLDVLPEHEA